MRTLQARCFVWLLGLLTRRIAWYSDRYVSKNPACQYKRGCSSAARHCAADHHTSDDSPPGDRAGLCAVLCGNAGVANVPAGGYCSGAAALVARGAAASGDAQLSALLLFWLGTGASTGAADWGALGGARWLVRAGTSLCI